MTYQLAQELVSDKSEQHQHGDRDRHSLGPRITESRPLNHADFKDNHFVFNSPEGPNLTATQAAELDDSYFQSRPFGYFSSRIATLSASGPIEKNVVATDVGPELAAALGQTSISDLIDFNDSDRELQIATDSFALRHHAAESLVRLYHGLTIGITAQGSAPCVWAAVAEGPTRTIDLVDQARTHLMSPEGHQNFWRMVFPETVASQHNQEHQANQALNVIGDWLHHAMTLLVRDDININAAHNKVKHGLSVRTRDDLRLTFTTQAPNADGTVPLSALTGDKAFDIFDTPTIDYLARPPRKGNRKQGLEVSSLKLAPATLLAETWMMSIAHAAMFHVAADRHFTGRDIPFQPLPKLPLGPTPTQLLGESVVGMRHPVTTPPDGGPVERRAGIAFQSTFVPLEINFNTQMSGKVVEG